MRQKKPLSAVEKTLNSTTVYIFLIIYTVVVFGFIIGYSVLPELEIFQIKIFQNDIEPLLVHGYLVILTGYATNKGVLRWKGEKPLEEDRRRGQCWVFLCWLVVLALGLLKQAEFIQRYSEQLLEVTIGTSAIFFGGIFWKKFLQKLVANGKA